MLAESAGVAVAGTGCAAVVGAGLGLLDRRGLLDLRRLLGCRGLLDLLGLLVELNVLSA